MTPATRILPLLALLALAAGARAAGVFEFELSNATLPATANDVKVFVCLKEAFASNLQEPCTYANASLVLFAAPEVRAAPGSAPAEAAGETRAKAEAAAVERSAAGRKVSKQVVRIAFTFRWTVSFAARTKCCAIKLCCAEFGGTFAPVIKRASLFALLSRTARFEQPPKPRQVPRNEKRHAQLRN